MAARRPVERRERRPAPPSRWPEIGLALAATDALAAFVVGPFAFWTTSATDDPGVIAYVMFALTPILTVAALHEQGQYRRPVVLRPLQCRRVAVGWLQAFGLLLAGAAVLSAVRSWSDSAGADLPVLPQSGGAWVIVYVVSGVATLLASRLLWAVASRNVTGLARIHGRALVIGTGPVAERVIAGLRDDCCAALDVVGVLTDAAEDEGRVFSGLDVLGGIDSFFPVVQRTEVDTVIVALPWTAQAKIAAILAMASHIPVDVRLVPDEAAANLLACQMVPVAGLQFIDVQSRPISGRRAALKRVEDIALASLLLVVLAPLLVSVSIAIKLDSRGPVLFRQPRYGFNNRVFRICKFRSMHADMSDIASARQTSRGDDRVTGVGAFLRRHSFDELPQLLNVLRGDMSMVGPRPHALGTQIAGTLVEDALETYFSRCRVKPGITGWAQVNGWRGELDSMDKLKRRIAHDLDYIENWSILLDLKIILKTFSCVLRDGHAY